jgi:hypothetical protein
MMVMDGNAAIVWMFTIRDHNLLKKILCDLIYYGVLCIYGLSVFSNNGLGQKVKDQIQKIIRILFGQYSRRHHHVLLQ